MQAEFEAKKSKEKLTNFEAENEVSLCHFLPNFVIWIYEKKFCVIQWFCNLCVLRPWRIKIPKDAK